MIEFDLGRFSKKADALDEDEIMNEISQNGENGTGSGIPGTGSEIPGSELAEDGFLSLPEGTNTPFEDENGQFNLPFMAFS